LKDHLALLLCGSRRRCRTASPNFGDHKNLALLERNVERVALGQTGQSPEPTGDNDLSALDFGSVSHARCKLQLNEEIGTGRTS
jgi:hypothetical protein